MAWYSEVYQKTVLIVLSLIFSGGIIVYLLRKHNQYFISSWASIKSWLIAAPILFLLFGFPDPGPLIVLTCLAILGAKVFFQIMGMYPMAPFVMTTYFGIIGLALCAQFDNLTLYNNMPMIVLGVSCLIPILKNAYKRMIQYVSLTLLGFIFLGWSFMHLALILKLPNGLYQVLYLIVLTEFCDNTNLAVSRHFGGPRIFSNINTKRTLLGTGVSFATSLILAAMMRWILPDGSDHYWLATGIVASIGGMFGDLVMTFIRKDAGVRVVGQFIIGRGDFLNRMDRLMFVAPIYYYTMVTLQYLGG